MSDSTARLDPSLFPFSQAFRRIGRFRDQSKAARDMQTLQGKQSNAGALVDDEEDTRKKEDEVNKECRIQLVHHLAWPQLSPVFSHDTGAALHGGTASNSRRIVPVSCSSADRSDTSAKRIHDFMPLVPSLRKTRG